ncbi:snake venom vascular endothelial growth factor toxin barietin-like [Oppia nitens]|uniref:snake venom vascular endothelial growth factor toxin barietin-like n=1 Tax=Oppia nitens TaxID=1686743 RepID=UPI0023D9A972|nr:snake venom vascular endothelial growth factor toxin barietin-like [Oppia nitens]
MDTKLYFWSTIRTGCLILLYIAIVIRQINCLKPNESLLASQHFSRILKEAKCQQPVPRVVNIQELFPSATKKYIPHCTLMHFCGYDTGCCRQENERCVPKTVQDVDLYFFTVELTPRGQRKGVEMITMQNHTECMCQPINDSPR